MSRRTVSTAPAIPLRVLYVPRLGEEPCDPVLLSSARRFVDRLADMGCQVSENVMPLNLNDMTAHWKTVAEVGMSRLFAADEALACSASDQSKAMAERGAATTVDQLLQVLDTVRQLRIDASQLYAHWDFIVTPATAAMPWEAANGFPPEINGQVVGPRGHAAYSGWVNAIGHPAIAVPSQPSAAGMPIGVQLVSDLGGESLLLDFAERLEAESGGFQWPENFA